MPKRGLCFRHNSVYPRVRISQPASETDVWLFFWPTTLKIVIYYPSFLSFLTFYEAYRSFPNVIRCFFRGGTKVTSLLKFRVLTSCLTSRVSCLSPWARQNFPAPQKTEKKPCLIGKKCIDVISNCHRNTRVLLELTQVIIPNMPVMYECSIVGSENTVWISIFTKHVNYIITCMDGVRRLKKNFGTVKQAQIAMRRGTLKCLSIGTPKSLIFRLSQIENSWLLRVPVFKHIIMRLYSA